MGFNRRADVGARADHESAGSVQQGESCTCRVGIGGESPLSFFPSELRWAGVTQAGRKFYWTKVMSRSTVDRDGVLIESPIRFISLSYLSAYGHV
jgi:hypothetical protein